MQARYVNELRDTVIVTLVEGETLSHLTGPVTASVPAMPGNAAYDELVARGVDLADN